jgi:transcriptional regulator
VDDAPARFVDGQLKAIVGVSMAVTGVEAKAKLSQNRSDADQAGVVEGLAGSADLGAAAVRAEMIRGRQTH